jgi:hypothetical protein
MQEAYFALHESFCLNGIVASSVNTQAYAQIHVEIMLPARYAYTMSVPTRSTFVCTATGNVDTDATIDTWTIDQTGTLINTIDDTSM